MPHFWARRPCAHPCSTPAAPRRPLYILTQIKILIFLIIPHTQVSVAWGNMKGLSTSFGALLVATDGSGAWALYDVANATLVSSDGPPHQNSAGTATARRRSSPMQLLVINTSPRRGYKTRYGYRAAGRGSQGSKWSSLTLNLTVIKTVTLFELFLTLTHLRTGQAMPGKRVCISCPLTTHCALTITTRKVLWSAFLLQP